METMNRQEFLRQLRACLSGHMPPGRVEDAISYYEEYFLESGEAGETAVLTELGDPQSVAARILGGMPPRQPQGGVHYIDYGAQKRRGKRGRGFRIFAAVATAFLACGLALVVFRNVAVQRRTEVPVPIAPPFDYAVAEALPDVAGLSTVAPFHSLTLDVGMASVDIIVSDDYGIELHDGGVEGRLQFEVESDGLRVWEDTRVGLPGAAGEARVVILIPHGVELTDLNLHTSRGNLNISGLVCQSLTVRADMGNIDLSDITAERLDLSLSAGALCLSSVTAQEAVLSGALGTVDLYDGSFGTLSVDWQGGRVYLSDCRVETGELHNTLGEIDVYHLTSNALTVSGQGGSIHIWGELRGLTTVTQSLGTVEVMTDLPRSEYAYDLQTTLGSISLDGRTERGHITSTSDAPNRLVVENQSGDVEVFFAY